MKIKIKLWLIKKLRRWLRKLGWPGFEPVTKTMPAQMLTIEARAILPFGEDIPDEVRNEWLARELGRQAIKYAEVSTDTSINTEFEEYDRIPCVRAVLRVVPFHETGGIIFKKRSILEEMDR